MTNADMEGIPWMRVVLAFIAVFGLIGLMAMVLKYVKMSGFTMPGTNARDRRLGVVEVLPIDPRRKLVIIRRDGTEHLLLLGLNEDIVIETNLDNKHSGIQTKGEG